MKGMKILVLTLIDSLSSLANVLVFLLFVVILFAIIGLQLFSGIYENRCRISPKPINHTWQILENYNRLCGTISCPPNSYCGNPAHYNIP